MIPPHLSSVGEHLPSGPQRGSTYPLFKSPSFWQTGLISGDVPGHNNAGAPEKCVIRIKPVNNSIRINGSCLILTSENPFLEKCTIKLNWPGDRAGGWDKIRGRGWVIVYPGIRVVFGILFMVPSRYYSTEEPMAQSQNNTRPDISTLEGWLWEAACKIRGEIDAPKYKDYILPLIFLKRLSDVFDDEAKKMEGNYGNRDLVEKILAEDHQLVRFYLPPESRWDAIAKKSTGLGELITDSMRSIARENPKLQPECRRVLYSP